MFFSISIFDFFGNQITGWNLQKKLFLKKNNYVKEINMHLKIILDRENIILKLELLKILNFKLKRYSFFENK